MKHRRTPNILSGGGGRCFSPIYRGCNTKLNNLKALTTQVEKEKLAGEVMRDKCAASSSDATNLITGDRHMSATATTSRSKVANTDIIHVSHNDIKHMQTRSGLTKNQTFRICSDLPLISKNRKLIQPGLMEFLHENNLLNCLLDIVFVENSDVPYAKAQKTDFRTSNVMIDFKVLEHVLESSNYYRVTKLSRRDYFI